MRALDERTGRLIWVKDTETEGCYSSPAADGGTLYVGSDGLGNSRLFAVEPKTGRVKWTFPTTGQIFSTPAVADGVVYFHARDDHVYAVKAGGGDLVWKTPAPFPQQEFAVFSDMSKSSPAVADGRLFVGVGKSLVALDAVTGNALWRTETRGKVDSSPLVVGKTVYVGSDDRGIYGFAAESGEERWAFRTGGRVSASPSVGDGLLLIGSNDGHLYAFGAK